MEKKYCVHCRTLTNDETVCHICGKQEFQLIKINVQYQVPPSNKD
jgi:hypothetical protein